MADATQEIENTADDGSFLSIVADWIEDLMEQQISGSVVLLILVAVFAPKIFSLIAAYWNRDKP